MSHVSSYGRHSCKWEIKGSQLEVHIEVPPNTTAKVVLPGVEEEVGSGKKSYNVKWEADASWPPKIWFGRSIRAPPLDEVVE